MARHIAIMSGKELLNAVLNGDKTVEARLTQNKVVPFAAIAHNDEILFKLGGGLVYGQARVDNVLFYEGLTGEIIGKLRKQYGKEMMVGDDFWRSHSNARYASVIFLKQPRRFLTPVKIEKHDRRPWVVLER